MPDAVIVTVGGRILTVDHYFLEAVASVLEGERFLCHLLLVRYHPGRLDVDSFVAAIDHEIDFMCAANMLAVGGGFSLERSHVNGISVPQQFVVDDVLHQVRVFNLPEVESSVAEASVGSVVFVRIVKMMVSPDVKSLGFGDEKGVREVVEILDDCISVILGSSCVLQEICYSRWIGKASYIAHYGVYNGIKNHVIAQPAFFQKVFQVDRAEESAEVFPLACLVLHHRTFREPAISEIFEKCAVRVCLWRLPCMEFGKGKRSYSNYFASASEFCCNIAS